MDNEQARFVLRSFRPDGADVDDGDFAEALHLAAEDRELGEWLARERAFDASFSAALNSVKLPETLREDILAGLAASRGDLPQAEDWVDITMIGAFAAIRPPVALRGELIAAMERSALTQKKISRPVWKRVAIPLSAAAGIALAFFVTHQPVAPPIALNAPVPVELVEVGFIRTFESPLFSLDENRSEHLELIQHLKERKLPCPKSLPTGLVGVKAIGCRELQIDGKHGSLVCFDEKLNGVVHLVIFKRGDVCGKVPGRTTPTFTQYGPWAIARWENEGHVFMLLGSKPVDQLSKLF